MSKCDALAANAPSGVAASLRAVDCLANDVTQTAFGRLFGTNGALLPALSILLTLYIAFFAISLLTGRSRISISALTPRMMTLGMVLTFATSWVAYQSVVWTMAISAPDQIASILMGTNGSATRVFADRIDIIFSAISQVADPGVSPDGAARNAAASGSFTPSNLMWLGALLLLLGTVGVLVTARIALAVLLALGPIFVIFALFSGTRGLTAGWLKGLVLTAVVPLFVVVGGGITMELLIPVVASLGNGPEGASGRGALGLFLVASIHVALMIMVVRVAGTMVAGWRVFGLADTAASDVAPSAETRPAMIPETMVPAADTPSATSSRRHIFASLSHTATSHESTEPAASTPQHGASRSVVVRQIESANASPLPPRVQHRARGVGSRFRPVQRQVREINR